MPRRTRDETVLQLVNKGNNAFFRILVPTLFCIDVLHPPRRGRRITTVFSISRLKLPLPLSLSRSRSRSLSLVPLEASVESFVRNRGATIKSDPETIVGIL